jgi:hypothetical protein
MYTTAPGTSNEVYDEMGPEEGEQYGHISVVQPLACPDLKCLKTINSISSECGVMTVYSNSAGACGPVGCCLLSTEHLRETAQHTPQRQQHPASCLAVCRWSSS